MTCVNSKYYIYCSLCTMPAISLERYSSSLRCVQIIFEWFLSKFLISIIYWPLVSAGSHVLQWCQYVQDSPLLKLRWQASLSSYQLFQDMNGTLNEIGNGRPSRDNGFFTCLKLVLILWPWAFVRVDWMVLSRYSETSKVLISMRGSSERNRSELSR